MPLAASLLFWMEEDRPGFQAYLDQVAVGCGRSTFEGRSVMPNGSIKFWRLFCEPEFVEGSCVALHGAAQDTTEAREVLERERIALRAADEMSGFLATMSHEIRTPLNGVLGMADVMARGELSPSQRQHLDVIATSGQALLSLLNNLLDLSKIEAGQIKLEDDVVDPRSLAEGAKAMFGALVQGKALVLDLIVEPSAHRTWRGDPKRIGQVVHNLISNAVKFTHHGVVTVTFACEADRLVIRVQDTGIGVPSNRVAYIFDRFVQADASTTRDHGGAGLGLTLCRDLIRLMNGEIGVVSIEGAGAMFTVNLPLASNPDAAAPADTATAPLDAALRVLVAEDNAINQLVLKTQLSAVGIEPVITGNGQEAVEAWRLSEWDIVLMDIQMPVMDGLTAVQIIREAEQSSGRKRTPILAVTANAMSHHLANYLAAGMDGLIAKPVNMALLLETMDAVLGADEMDYPSPVIGRA